MSKRARRLGGALSLLMLLALAAAGISAAGGGSSGVPVVPTKGSVHLVGRSTPSASAPSVVVQPTVNRLAARLLPTSSTSAASGHWDGILVHTTGVVHTGALPLPGCSVTGPRQGVPARPPRRSTMPARTIHCGGPVPPFAAPSTSGQHWFMGWMLRYTNLSSAATGADIRLNSPGAAGTVATTLCAPCVSSRFGRTILTDDQAAAILKGDGYIVVRTVNNPTGEPASGS